MISVIIPTLNEASNLNNLLDRLGGQCAAEFIVVDGGSIDGTQGIAVAHKAHLLQTAPGRGRQLKTGASAANGDILWFLHADCRVGSGAFTAIDREMANHPDAPGGNFRLLFDGNDGFSRWLNGFYERIRARGFYYGDSGVFVRRKTYHQIGGIRVLALMEDYDFNRRLERIGGTRLITDPPLVTSSRRFEGRRKWAIISQWLIIHGLYYMGFPSAGLAWIYNSTRRRNIAPDRTMGAE